MPRKTTGKLTRIRPKEAARYLGVSGRFLYDLTKRGRIPCYRLGKRFVLYDPRDLDAFMDDCRVG